MTHIQQEYSRTEMKLKLTQTCQARQFLITGLSGMQQVLALHYDKNIPLPQIVHSIKKSFKC